MQTQLKQELVMFNNANMETQKAMGNDAINQHRFFEHCAYVAVDTMEGYEDDLEKVNEENQYLHEENTEYKKKHGKLDARIC